MYQKVYLIFWGSRIALVCACSVNIARQLQSQTVQSRRELESATFLESRVCSNSGKSLYQRYSGDAALLRTSRRSSLFCDSLYLIKHSQQIARPELADLRLCIAPPNQFQGYVERF